MEEATMMKTRKVPGFASCLLVLAGVLGGSAAIAESVPTEKPILTISGKINSTNPEGAVFDRAQLEALGMVSFETKTPWYKESVKFEGVPLDKLMAKVGSTGDRVLAIALNDYSVEIPIEDFAKYHAILALKRDGEYMSVRDKGPLFVVYPFDSDPDLRS